MLSSSLSLVTSFPPTFKIGDTELREIDILSDLSRQKKELKDVIPAPKNSFYNPCFGEGWKSH